MTLGLPSANSNALKYTGDQINDVPCVSAARAPTTADINYPLLTLWRNSNKLAVLPDAEGDLWYLAKFTPNGQLAPLAIWIKIIAAVASSGVLTLSDLSSVKVMPDGSGNIQFTSSGGTIAIVSNPSSHLINLDVTGVAASEKFTVNNFVGPGTNPVVPDGTGNVNVFGTTVAAGGTPLQTISRAANTYNVEAQISSAQASSTPSSNGLSHFSNSQFTVDGNGFVQLAGGFPAMEKFTVNAAAGSGTNPVLADGTANVNVLATTVAAGTIPIQTISRAANTYNVEVQRSSAQASSTASANGLSHFNSAQFTVDGNGFVGLAGGSLPGIETIQTDTGAGTLLQGAAINLNSTSNFATNTSANSIAVTATDTTHGKIAVQLAGSNAGSSTPNKFGVAQFDSNQFNVTSGFVQLSGGTTAAIETVTGDTGGAVGPTASNIFWDGATTTYVTGNPSTHTLKTEVVSTANTFLLGAGATTASTTIGPLTNGQVIIGSTGVAPVASTLTQGQNTLITNGAGSITIASNVTTGISNIAISLAAGVFSITAANGSSLSASNPGYVVLPSIVSPGRLISLTVTANQTFQDSNSGGSFLAGNTFGVSVTGAIAYNQDLPFYLYAAMNLAENAVNFSFSRVPHRRAMPGSGHIAKQGSAVAALQGDMFMFGNPTVANFFGASCLPIGSFRMQSTTSLADWTVQTLNIHDGIGNMQDDNTFNMVLGSFGAASGSFFTSNGGTAPIFSTNVLAYKPNRYGTFQLYSNLATLTNSPAGAVQAQMISPYNSTNLFLGGNATILQTNNNPLAAYLNGSNVSNAITFTKSAGGNLNNVDFLTASAFFLNFNDTISQIL